LGELQTIRAGIIAPDRLYASRSAVASQETAAARDKNLSVRVSSERRTACRMKCAPPDFVAHVNFSEWTPDKPANRMYESRAVRLK
jgi:hypothetical protein